MGFNISFVIPVHNHLDFTKKCLADLDAQKDSVFFSENNVRTIVVDDGSSDGTGEWLSREHPEIHVIRGDGNLWYSKSTNLGMKHAFGNQDADFVMVWENDTLPMKGYFDHLQEILENWDGRTVICSKLYYSHRQDHIFGMGGTFNPRTGKKALIGRALPDGPEFQTDREVDIFLGIGFMVHKDLVAKTGYLDEKNFPHYHADFDYALRMKENGFRNVVFHRLGMLNDMETTGISHKKNKSLKDFLATFTSIKSNLNVRRNLKFYRRHTTSPKAYLFLLRIYFIHSASFFKWWVLGWFGVQKDSQKVN